MTKNPKIIEIFSSEEEEEKGEEAYYAGSRGLGDLRGDLGERGRERGGDPGSDDDDVVFIHQKSFAEKTRKNEFQGEEITFISQRSIPPVANGFAPSLPRSSIPAIQVQTCYGMIETALVNINATNAKYSSTLSSVPFAPVRISINQASQKPFQALFFYEFEENFPIADLNDITCRDLSPVLPMIRFDCRACIFGPRPVVRMIIYGSQSNAAYIGSVLKNHTLLKPDIQPKHPYFNPHTAISNSAMVGGGGIASIDPLQKRIQDQFRSLTAPENMAIAEPDKRLTAKLYKYQKQGLAWMQTREQGMGEQFWRMEGRNWRNIVTNQIEQKEPSVLRGGILADDMGLGKTIQIIALILTNQPKRVAKKPFKTPKSVPKQQPTSSTAAFQSALSLSEKWAMLGRNQYDFGFVPPEERPKSLLEDEENPLVGSLPSKCTLIVCPLSTIYNWEDQISSHSQKGSLKVLVYHGGNRTDNPEMISINDVIITTYNILASGFTKNDGCSPLHQIYWHRVVLDEAHIIKSQTTIQAKAAYDLKTDIRWCLTGTPLQNKLDDLYSLIRFLRVEPLNKKSEWTFHIGKPVKNNDSVAFSKLQLLMKVMTLRRTKTDVIDGKPIIQLPPRTEEVRLLELDGNERKLYDEVHRRGKAYFDSLKAGGGTIAVMKNYIQILTCILMMRQACLHPSLVKLDKSPVVEDEEDDLRALDSPLSLEQSKKIYHFMRQVGEDNCVICGCCLEGADNCVIPCKHMVCTACISAQLGASGGSGQSMKASSSKAIFNAVQTYCPLCRIPFTHESICKIPEAEIDRAEDEEGLSDDPVVKSGVARQSMGTKIRALIEDLKAAKVQDPTTKSVVFSQFTAVLNLCEKPLRDAGFKFVRLDGSMTRNSRSDAEKEFKTNARVNVFLISIKSGGVGLNLTSGNRVYLLEPYWNPAVEQQAIDRVHRMGQTRPVTTIRFIINDSVEINMQKRQRYKTALADKALDEDVLEGDDPAHSSSTTSAASRKKRKRTTSREDTLNEKMESLNILFRRDTVTSRKVVP